MTTPRLALGERLVFAVAVETIILIFGTMNTWHPFAIFGMMMLGVAGVLVVGGWVGEGSADPPNLNPLVKPGEHHAMTIRFSEGDTLSREIIAWALMRYDTDRAQGRPDPEILDRFMLGVMDCAQVANDRHGLKVLPALDTKAEMTDDTRSGSPLTQ